MFHQMGLAACEFFLSYFQSGFVIVHGEEPNGVNCLTPVTAIILLQR